MYNPSQIFNDFFAPVGEKLTSKFGDVTLPNFDVTLPSNQFEFLSINPNYVLEELLSLPNKSSLDILNMDSKLLRLASPIIVQVIAHIFNLSLALGTLPADWKIARVTPIYKNIGPRDNPSNYRPISVVSNVTKIIEKHVKGQLVEFLLKNNLLCHEQHAYLKNHSTTTALHSLTEHWLDNINSSEINGLCQLDLSKGFDTVNIEILLYKLAKYGFSDQSLFWFKSYFIDRSQVVSCNGKLSKPNSLSMGIPQGTVLGPLFYLL